MIKCLILGASFNQLELIKAAKKRGYHITVVTPYKDDPGVNIADKLLEMDIKESDAICRAVKHEAINLVVSDQSDLASLSQAMISKELGLPGEDPVIVERFANKFKTYQMSVHQQNNIQPESYFFERVASLYEFIVDYGAPIEEWLVKPRNSQGSRGVSRLSSIDYKNIIENAFNISGGDGVFLQKYITGRHYSVEAYTYMGSSVALTATVKTKFSNNQNLDLRNIILSPKSKEIPANLVSLHLSIVKEFGLENGITHGEYVVDDLGKIYLIEIAARGAGGNINGLIIPAITGFRTMEFLLDIAQGMSPNLYQKDSFAEVAGLRFFSPNDVVDIQKWKELAEKNSNLLYCEFDEKKTSSRAIPRDSRDRPGYIIIKGNSIAEVQKLENEIIDEIVTNESD